MRRLVFPLLAIFCLLIDRPAADACKIEVTPSLLDRFLNAPVIAMGRFQKHVGPDNASPDGQTELVIDELLVPHDALKGRKSLLVPREITAKGKFLVEIEVVKGKIEAYGGVELDAKGEIEKYVRGALKLKDKSAVARFRYSVDFLLSPDAEVARSALLEMGRLSYADLRKVAEGLKPEPFVRGLQDPKANRRAMDAYAMLLGHCGKKEHAEILRILIEDKRKEKSPASHGMLVACTLLDRAAGWALVEKASKDRDGNFLTRYAALQSARFFHDQRKDVIDHKKVLAAVANYLSHPDMADFAVEDFRRWQRWEYCDEILALPAKKGFDTPIMRKSVLRYALECPSPAAKAHVQFHRNRDPEWVSEAEELLELEREPKK